MPKNTWTFILFILFGVLIGSVIAELLASVTFLHALSKSVQITWEPKADLHIIEYDLFFKLKVNLFTFIGVIGAILIYRKL